MMVKSTIGLLLLLLSLSACYGFEYQQDGSLHTLQKIHAGDVIIGTKSISDEIASLGGLTAGSSTSSECSFSIHPSFSVEGAVVQHRFGMDSTIKNHTINASEATSMKVVLGNLPSDSFLSAKICHASMCSKEIIHWTKKDIYGLYIVGNTAYTLSPLYLNSAQFVIEARVYLPSAPIDSTIFSVAGLPSQWGFGFRFLSSAELHLWGGDRGLNFAMTSSAGWYHILLRVDAGNLRFVVNGGEFDDTLAMENVATVPSPSVAVIGGFQAQSALTYHGASNNINVGTFVQYLRIFNSATFTDEEIADLHANSEYPLNQKNTIFDTSYSAVPTSGESEGAYVIPMSQLF